jgi:hypothetical protein
MNVQISLGAALIALYGIFWFWHSQRGRKLTNAEIDQYLSIIAKLPSPTKEIDAVISRMRAWAAADDGKPVYMFNLMRFFPQLRTFQVRQSSGAHRSKPMRSMKEPSHGCG